LARAAQWRKKTLLLFALTHQFLQQLIEGDALYTRVQKKVAPNESQGWTIVLMERATRFLWDMPCGRKDRTMFKKAMGLLCQVIQQTGDLTLLTDGERRYGSLLVALCRQALRHGKRGRPKQTLPKGVKVRLKNKGSQRHKRGPKRPKYQAPYPEHPDTAQPVATTDIHAQSSGSLPYVAETTLCGLSQTYQYVCQEARTTPRQVRCVLDCASFRPRALYNSSRPGSGFRDSGPWLCAP